MAETSRLALSVLKATGLYSDESIARIAAQREANPGMGLAEATVKFGGVKEAEFLQKVGEFLGFAYVDLEKVQPRPDVLQKLPASAVYKYNAMPLRFDGGELTVAVSDPFSTVAGDGLRLAADCPVKTVLAPAEDIDKAIKKFYGVGADAIEKMIEDGRYAVDDEEGSISKIDVGAEGEEASIVKFVNRIIAEADRQGATDIHIEPQETELRIRYRIDGMLHKVDVPPQLNRLKSAIISRIKVMANLDIAEKRLPMDGRIGIRLGGEDIDIRVSTMPGAWGESISLRLLAKSGNFVKMCDLGFNDRDFAVVDKIIRRPNGIFLVTGPTGSGKSTSLYSFLHEVNTMDVRILTAEDPIEYQMDGIIQVQMNKDIGLDFARTLRAFLRVPPPGPGQDHGGRNPRPRDGRDRHQRLAHRPHGVLHAPHEHGGGRVPASHRHGRGAVPHRVRRRGRDGPAPLPPPLPEMPARGAARPQVLRPRVPAGEGDGVRAGGMRRLQPHGLQGPPRALRGAGGGRGDRERHRQARERHAAPGDVAREGHEDAARGRLGEGLQGRHVRDGDPPRDRGPVTTSPPGGGGFLR